MSEGSKCPAYLPASVDRLLPANRSVGRTDGRTDGQGQGDKPTVGAEKVIVDS